MFKLCSFLLLSSILVLSGCSSQVKRNETANTTRPVVKALQNFSIDMSPEAELKLADNVKFDINALESNLDRALKANNLMAPNGDFRLKVTVNDIRVRSTFNAVMWGFMAGDDHLTGKVTVLNLEDKPVYEFEASASYALGGLGGGQDSSRMNWLYEEFSELVVNELLQKKNE
jgi:hypothetical protein